MSELLLVGLLVAVVAAAWRTARRVRARRRIRLTDGLSPLRRQRR